MVKGWNGGVRENRVVDRSGCEVWEVHRQHVDSAVVVVVLDEHTTHLIDKRVVCYS